jgi:hypothetical protein
VHFHQFRVKLIGDFSRVRLSEDGSELIFENGKSVGHRSLQLYYKQRMRGPPSQAVSLVKNYLLNQYKLLGWRDSQTTDSKLTSIEEKRRKWEQTRIQKQQMRLGIQRNNYAHHRLQVEF